jgi:hypothetical protein
MQANFNPLQATRAGGGEKFAWRHGIAAKKKMFPRFLKADGSLNDEFYRQSKSIAASGPGSPIHRFQSRCRDAVRASRRPSICRRRWLL